MKIIIKEVEPVVFRKRLPYVGGRNLLRLAASLTFSIVFFLGGLGFLFSLVPLLISIPILYPLLKHNENYINSIRIVGGEIVINYVDYKMRAFKDIYPVGQFKSGLFTYDESFSPLSIRFFSGKFRTEEVLIQPVTKHWPLSELERVHAEIMAVVPPIGQGDGVK